MFSDLEQEDNERLAEQRQLVCEAIASLKGLAAAPSRVSAGDLQMLVDANTFAPDSVYELQCMGVCVGDVICERDGFRWVVVNDEYGRDLTVLYRETGMVINALTTVQKRVQSGEEWYVTDITERLPDIMLQQLAEQGLT